MPAVTVRSYAVGAGCDRSGAKGGYTAGDAPLNDAAGDGPELCIIDLNYEWRGELLADRCGRLTVAGDLHDPGHKGLDGEVEGGFLAADCGFDNHGAGGGPENHTC